MSKRSVRDLELAYVAEEILEVVRARDENNVPLHPEIMLEPVAFVLFSTPDALLDVLKNKPLRVLNLIRTNKVVNEVWRNIPGIWPMMLDNLLALEENADHLSKIYPFFMVAQRRVEELARPLLALNTESRRNRAWTNPMIVDAKSDGQALLPKFRRPVQVLGRNYRGARYALIYYDVVTQHFMDLLQKLLILNQSFGLGSSSSYFFMIANYVGVELEHPNTSYALKLPDYVAVLSDCFLVTENTEISYHPAVMRDSLKKIIAFFERHTFSEIALDSPHFVVININHIEAPSSVIKAIMEVKADALRLQKLLTTELVMEMSGAPPPKRLQLDEDMVRPYRDTLFNRENGLYNTPELQQKLFVDVLSALYAHRYADEDIAGGKAEFIWRYGSNLQCSVCKKETEHVDPVLLRAFCSDSCRSVHS